MEYQKGADTRGSLRLVDAGGEAVWTPDPAADAAEMDALAELFIGDDESIGGAVDSRGDAGETPRAGFARPNGARGAAKASARAGAAVEAVITGHLPVRGAVWVRAYAAAVSRRERRPVALVRVTGDRTTVELVGSAVATEPVADIDLAIQAVSSATEHFLLHFDEVDQAGLLREPTVDRVTVLSGADEPAVVSAYRLLKGVCDDRGDAVAEGALDVGVSIVGSGPDETARATDRLGVAARRFLSVDLSGRAAVPKIETATVSMIGESDERRDPGAVLETVGASVRAGDAGAGCPSSAVAAALGAAREPAETPAEPERAQSPGFGPGGRAARGTGPAAPSAATSAAPAVAPEGLGDRPLPSTLISGLTGMGLPCPVAPGVELATDAEGGLHLLSWWDDAAPGALLRARVWAGVNLPLLARLGPVDATGRHASMHVVCDAVGVAADLRGGELRVHLAQPVSAATANGWVTTAVE